MIFQWLLLFSELSTCILFLSYFIFLAGVLIGLRRIRDAEVFRKAMPNLNFCLLINCILIISTFAYVVVKNIEGFKTILSTAIESIMFIWVVMSFFSILIAVLDSFRKGSGEHGQIITKYIRNVGILISLLLFGMNYYLGGFN